MAKKRISLFVVTAVFSLSAAVFAGGDADTLKQIAGYSNWTTLTDNPYQLTTFEPLA